MHFSTASRRSLLENEEALPEAGEQYQNLGLGPFYLRYVFFWGADKCVSVGPAGPVLEEAVHGNGVQRPAKLWPVFAGEAGRVRRVPEVGGEGHGG